MQDAARHEESVDIVERLQSSGNETCKNSGGEESGNASGEAIDTTTLHYHGSCSQCHHFHRHVPFTVPIDDTRPARFYCERCRHPIFGLGRTETQITLASQDSFPLTEGIVDSTSNPEICENSSIPRPDPEPPTSTRQLGYPSMNAQLDAIEEQATVSDIVVPRSGPLGETTDGLVNAHPSASPSAMPGAELTISCGRPTQGSHDRQKWSSMLLKYVYSLLERVADRICGRPRQFNFLGFELNIHLTSNFSQHSDRMNVSAPQTSTGENSQSKSHPRLETGKDRIWETQPLSAEPGQRTSLSGLPQNGQPRLEFFRNVSPRRIQRIGTLQRQEQLRNYRRDQTLRRNALKRRCDCTQDCHCKLPVGDTLRDPHTGSSSPSGGNARQRRDIQSHDWILFNSSERSTKASGSNCDSSLSQYDLGTVSLAHIGSLFSPRRRPPEESLSSASNNYGSRRRAPAVRSNMSSVSLDPSRPDPPRRSLSSPALFASPSRGRDNLFLGDIVPFSDPIEWNRDSASQASIASGSHNGSGSHTVFTDLSFQADEDQSTGALLSQARVLTNGDHVGSDQETQNLVAGVATSPSGHS